MCFFIVKSVGRLCLERYIYIQWNWVIKSEPPFTITIKKKENLWRVTHSFIYYHLLLYELKYGSASDEHFIDAAYNPICLHSIYIYILLSSVASVLLIQLWRDKISMLASIGGWINNICFWQIFTQEYW